MQTFDSIDSKCILSIFVISNDCLLNLGRYICNEIGPLSMEVVVRILIQDIHKCTCMNNMNNFSINSFRCHELGLLFVGRHGAVRACHEFLVL